MIILDHHIVPSRQRDDSARWLTHILGLPAPRLEGPFAAVDHPCSLRWILAP